MGLGTFLLSFAFAIQCKTIFQPTNFDAYASNASSRASIRDSIHALKTLQTGLLAERTNPKSLYRNSKYNLVFIDQQFAKHIDTAERLLSYKIISYKEYTDYFLRYISLSSFLPSSEILRVLTDDGRRPLSKSAVHMQKEIVDSLLYIPYANLKRQTKTYRLGFEESVNLSSLDFQRLYFTYRTPSLEAMSEFYRKGVLPIGLTEKVQSFDGSMLSLPHRFSRHDLQHAARFAKEIEVLAESQGLSNKDFMRQYSLWLKTYMSKARKKLTKAEYKILEVVVFAKNHESYDLFYPRSSGKLYDVSLSQKEIDRYLRFYPPSRSGVLDNIDLDVAILNVLRYLEP